MSSPSHSSQALALSLLVAVGLGISLSWGTPSESPPADPATLHLPPGSDLSLRPSEEIFPPQSIPLRFSHKVHVRDLGRACISCHPGGATSEAAADRLLPSPAETCDGCHGVDHRSPQPSSDLGTCATCHVGGAPSENRIAQTFLPAPNLKFNHKKHAQRGLECSTCHGGVADVDLATRDHLPRMAGCMECHSMPGPSSGDANGACVTCHLSKPDGTLQQQFSTGPLEPPSWMFQAEHSADWTFRHGAVAASNSGFCRSCHDEDSCAACHDGRVRDRRVHPGDWLAHHGTAAALDNPSCSSCHSQVAFCGDCHRRVGLGDGPVELARANGRFHPDPRVWTSPPRGPGHHAWEAQRNLDNCVSCHSERDCTSCHAATGSGTAPSPHPIGFSNGCAVTARQNPRSCLVCHRPNDRNFANCK